MKKYIILLVCFLLCSLFCIDSFAETADEIQQKYLSENRQELEAVRSTVQLNNENGADRHIPEASLDFDRAYRLYFLNDGDVIKAYEDEGSFGANITDKYAWILPYTDVYTGELEVVRSNNSKTGWALRVDTDFQTKTALNYDGVDASIKGVLENVLNSFPDADLSTIRYCSSKQFKCRLLYFSDNGEEYIVPYFAEPVSCFTTGQIYKAGDFIAAAKNQLDSDTETAKTENKTGSFDKIFIIYLVIGTAVVLVFVLIVVFMKSKKRKEEAADDNSNEKV